MGDSMTLPTNDTDAGTDAGTGAVVPEEDMRPSVEVHSLWMRLREMQLEVQNLEKENARLYAASQYLVVSRDRAGELNKKLSDQVEALESQLGEVSFDLSLAEHRCRRFEQTSAIAHLQLKSAKAALKQQTDYQQIAQAAQSEKDKLLGKLEVLEDQLSKSVRSGGGQPFESQYDDMLRQNTELKQQLHMRTIAFFANEQRYKDAREVIKQLSDKI